MSKTLIGVGLVSLLVIAPFQAYAAPTVELSAESRDRFSAVLFTFFQPDLASMEECHYNLFAADEAKDLNTLPGKGLSIATFENKNSLIQIIAGPLPRLAKKLGIHNSKEQRSAKVFFRALLSCPAAQNGMGELISITVNTSSRGTLLSVNRLIKKMKYNMQYYRP